MSEATAKPNSDLESLLHQLTATDPGVQSRAIKAMIKLVEQGAQPLSILLNAADHRYWRVRLDAIEFIVKRNPPEALALLKAFRNTSYHVSQRRIREYIEARHDNDRLDSEDLQMAKDILDGLIHAPRAGEDSISRDKKLLDRLNGTTRSRDTSGNTLNARDITAENVVVGSQTIICQAGPGQAQPPAPGPLPAADVRLLDLITGHFSLEELSVLAFELGIDADELAGDTKTAKALSLLRYCERRDLLAQLKDAMRKARPHIAGLIP